MKMKKLAFISLVTSLCFGSAHAITYEEVMSIAEKNATNIKLTEKDIEKTEYQLKEAKGNILPSLLLTGTYTRWDPNYISGFTPKNQYSVKAGLTQKIFDYQIFSLIKLSKVSVETQQVIKEDVKQKVKDTARRLFLLSLLNKEIVKIKEENLKYWQENYKYIEAKYKEGLLAKYDFMRASSQLQSAIADYESSKANYEKSVEDLKRFLMLEDITPPEGQLTQLIPDVDTSKIEDNTEIKVLKAQLKLADYQIDYQKAANYPSLSAFLNYQANNQRNFPVGNEIWKKGYNLGLSLNWQLFDGFAKDSRVLQAKVDKSKYEIQLQDKIKEVKTQITKTLIDLKALQTQLQAEKSNIEVSKESMRLSTERFKANITNLLEVLESQTNYQNANLNYLNVLYNYNIKVFDLMNLLGK
ncbi:MAG: TolC family protein [Hydrogenothermaceae bacterium]|nr:TolC family protein [Hydrogenothermaceae bacterium]